MPEEKPNEDEIQEEEDKLKLELDGHLKKIEELEKALDSKTESFEGLKTKIETLEKEMKAKEEAVETKEKETMSLEDRVKSFEEKLESQKKDYEDKIDYLKKKPILDEMFEMRKLDDDEQNFYKTLSLEQLTSKKEQWSGEEVKPITKTMGESADESQDVKNEDEKPDNKPLTEDEINEFVKDERMRSIMKKMIKKEEK